MSSKILDPRRLKRLQPAQTLRKLYDPESAPHRFRARTLAEARRWRKETRAALGETLGFTRLPPAPLAPRKIESVDKGDYVREKWLLRTSRDSLMPVYLLLPRKAPQPLPVVLALHGHGYGVKDIVGLWEDGGERNTPDGYQHDFGVALCRKGFAVAAPEISSFGERRTDFSFLRAGAPGFDSTCTHTAKWAIHLGGSALGLRVHDGKRLIDYLETRRDLDCSRLGAMGISGGGTHAFYSTCLDERIKACVISSSFCTYRDTILGMNHCLCNFVPGLHRFGEQSDLIGLIAPRPVLIEAGDHDPIFPFPAVRKAVRKARAVYRRLGAPEAIQTDYFEGTHRISGRLAYDFLREKLGAGL